MTRTPQLDSVAVMLERMGIDGFDHSFTLTQDGVRDLTTDARYAPEDVEIVAVHRNEGLTDPADEAILMLLRAPDGAEGFLVTPYGVNVPHADALRRLGRDA